MTYGARATYGFRSEKLAAAGLGAAAAGATGLGTATIPAIVSAMPVSDGLLSPASFMMASTIGFATWYCRAELTTCSGNVPPPAPEPPPCPAPSPLPDSAMRPPESFV